MGIIDQGKNTALAIGGRAKQAVGVVIGNRDLEGQGQADQITAHLRNAGSHVKGAGNQVKGAVGSVRKALDF